MTPSPSRGRRRTFDRDAALHTAMHAFWSRGFDAVSVADLTAEIGVAPPSLYAAFGDKRALFAETVEEYDRVHGRFFADALAAAPAVRTGVENGLLAAARQYTAPGHPRGCLVFSGAVNCTPGSADVQQSLRDRRAANSAALRDRIAAESPGLDAGALATYIGTVLQGMSQQARDGATAEQLTAVARLAMTAWPVD